MITSTIFYAYMGALFAIANPLGNTAIFIGLTADKSEFEKRKIAIQSSIAVITIWLLSVWLGHYILRIFGISVESFQIAGGIILMLLGLSMLHGKLAHATSSSDATSLEQDSVAIVPIAIPIIAGPGSITSIVAYVHQYDTVINKCIFSVGAAFVCLMIGLCFYYSTLISRLLGRSGNKIATKVMGLILVSIAVGMFLNGVVETFPALTL